MDNHIINIFIYKHMKIGILIIATNSYLPLGIRFIKKFIHHYKGKCSINFHFISDDNPMDYLPDNVNIKWIKQSHNSWVNATNSKFNNILSLDSNDDYLYYFDADTNIDKDFTEDWFIGDLVGGEHYGNKTSMLNSKPYDRNPKSKCYIPEDTELEQIYYYGAFFGGKLENVINFCKILKSNQDEDKKINYEPAVNDESYINHYFHYNPPTCVPPDKFIFIVSDKGGIENTRNVDKDISNLKNQMKSNKYRLFEININKLIFI